MLSLICVWINGWVNNREAGNLRRHRGHYDVTVMVTTTLTNSVYVSIWCYGMEYTWLPVMTSWHGNANRIIDHLWEKATCHRWSTFTGVSNARIWYFFDDSLSELLTKQSSSRMFDAMTLMWRNSKVISTDTEMFVNVVCGIEGIRVLIYIYIYIYISLITGYYSTYCIHIHKCNQRRFINLS